jgi:hypothetical protein
MDLKLTNFDVDLTNGELSLVTGLDAIRQDIEMKLRTFLGETPYDRSAGVPYLQVLFVRGVTMATVRFILEQKLLSIDGVTEVLELETDHNTTTRELVITGRVRAVDQEFPLEVQVNT